MKQSTNSSSLHRETILKHLSEGPFDLLVIGGGVTGCGIALDAASRGIRVALIEKNDFASGTSSKSTKLIHGGLRYLKQLEIGLVRETGQERAIVHKLAPHLVRPRKMLLPLIEGGTFGRLATSFGLRVYDFLADVERPDRRVMLSREETLEKEPILRQEGLLGSGYYAEYQTDDARLTIDLAMSAIQHGATCINYCEATDFIYSDEQVTGIKVKDNLTDKTFEIHATHIVSAAGPWVDKIRDQDQSLTGKRLFLSKGVHIVLPHARLPLKQAVYFDVPDGRMLFAIPRLRVTYIGTTDTPFDGDPNSVTADLSDVQYLLDGANSMFPKAHLQVDDIESSWAGLRPLIYEPGKDASEMSRKDEIFESQHGLISIAGGKLTGYRKMAERVVDLVSEKLSAENGRSYSDCKTKTLSLIGGPFKDVEEVNAYEKQTLEQIRGLGLADDRAHYLISNYGKKTATILDRFKSFTDTPETALARAELAHCIEQELCFTPDDFFNRRTGRLYFNITSIRPLIKVILADFSTYFNWSETKLKAETKALEHALKSHSEFYPA
ncbi:MAG: glycerol-3-phosphate dehydrogenase/oxidase [Saprospiraceae bacterium]|nr:glycerol-3-phosphate dehydrogenase/oxidase [Saprospiraceae bacterium]